MTVIQGQKAAAKEVEREERRAKRAIAARLFMLRWGIFVVLLGFWQALTTLTSSTYWPPPTRIIERMAQLWIPGVSSTSATGFVNDVIPSLWRMGAGLGAAIVIGVVLGIIIGVSLRFEGYADWILQFLRAVPPPTLFPVFLLLFGVSDSMRIALIAFGTVWPILLNTIEGVRAISPLTFEASRVFRIRPADRLLRVILPAASPNILAGVRTSLGLAFILMVISEMVAASNGIGFQLIQAQRTFLTLDMWAAIALLGILGYVLNLFLTFVERRLLLWQRLGGKETS